MLIIAMLCYAVVRLIGNVHQAAAQRKRAGRKRVFDEIFVNKHKINPVCDELLNKF